MSTNKVYGVNAPNEIPLIETKTRWDYADPDSASGIPETFRIDQGKHSIFCASKVAADILVQEYGGYFGMPTSHLRGRAQIMLGSNSAALSVFWFVAMSNAVSLRYTVTKENGFATIYTVMMLLVLLSASSIFLE